MSVCPSGGFAALLRVGFRRWPLAARHCRFPLLPRLRDFRGKPLLCPSRCEPGRLGAMRLQQIGCAAFLLDQACGTGRSGLG